MQQVREQATGGLIIRSDGNAGAPASIGSMSVFSAVGTTTTESSQYKLRLGSSARYLEISYPINGTRQHVNVETTQSTQHLRFSSATGQIGLLGNTQTQRTQDAVTVAGDIILENYGPNAPTTGGGNNQNLPAGQQETRTLFSKNFGTGDGPTARIDVINGLQYLGDPESLREAKNNIEDVTPQEAISIVKSLRPRKFTWKPREEDSPLAVALKALDIRYGFIAEEIEESQPHLATYKMTPEFQEAWPNVTEEMFNDFPLRFYKETALPSITLSAVKNLIERVEFLEAQLAAQ